MCHQLNNLPYNISSISLVFFFKLKIFQGNYDIYHTVGHKIMPGIRGRYIRIYPKTWYSYIALRVELYGCCPKGLSLAAIF